MLVVSSRYPCGERSPLSEVLSFWCIRKEITRMTGGKWAWETGGDLVNLQDARKWSWSLLLANPIMVLPLISCGQGQQLACNRKGDRGLDRLWKGKGHHCCLASQRPKPYHYGQDVLGGGVKKNQKPRWNVWQECVPINDLPDREEAPMALLRRACA